MVQERDKRKIGGATLLLWSMIAPRLQLNTFLFILLPQSSPAAVKVPTADRGKKPVQPF